MWRCGIKQLFVSCYGNDEWKRRDFGQVGTCILHQGKDMWNTDPKSASWVVPKIFKAKQYWVKAGCALVEFQQAPSFSIRICINRCKVVILRCLGS